MVDDLTLPNHYCSANQQNDSSCFISNAKPPYLHLPFRALGQNYQINAYCLYDSGSTHSLLPSKHLPADLLQQLEPVDKSFTGVSGSSTKALGIFRASLHICDFKFDNFIFYVMPSECPIIIGQDVFKHSTVRSVSVDYEKELFFMTRADSNGTVNRGETRYAHYQGPPQCDIITKTHHADASYLDPDFEDGIIEPKTDPSTLSTLESKLKWLKDELEIDLEHSNRAELESFADLLIEYKCVFGVGKDKFGTFPHEIKIPTNGESRSARQHTIPFARREIVTAEINKMLNDGIIEECPDPKGFSSPIVLVKKKTGDYRMCLNFRPTLNQVMTDGDSYPMDSTDSVFARIRPGNKYFSSMDLYSGYWHVVIAEEDRYKTAFWWNNKCYMFKRLPFGFSKSGNIFSRQLAEILQDCLNSDFISVYIDDITCHARNFKNFLKSHRAIFEALLKNGAKLKPSKCQFLKQKVPFLGRMLSEKGYEMDPANVQGIQDIEPPRTKKQLLSLIGRLLWVKQFIGTKLYEKLNLTSFSALMEPIYQLNSQELKTFKWTERAQEALDKIKSRLSSAPFISFADQNLPYSLTTDASQTGCSGVLMQIQNNRYKVIACISKRFNAVERRWSTTEREAFAIVWAIDKLSHYLLDSPFTVFTDHRSLCYIDRREFNNSKISNWQHKLSKYRFTIQYLPGANNHFADWLSRLDNGLHAKTPADTRAAGKFMRVKDSKLCIYVPSWCLGKGFTPDDKLYLEEQKSPGQIAHMAPAAFLCGKSADELPISPNCLQYVELGRAQREDAFLAPIISALEVRRANPNRGFAKALSDVLDVKSEKTEIYKSVTDKMYLEPVSNVLMIRRPGRFPQMVVPKSLRKYYLHSAHNNSSHAGRNRVTENLADFWWEGMSNDIISYLGNCNECGQRKGRYGKRPLKEGHCLRGKTPWEIIYIDYICLPNVRGKKYCLTLMDSLTKYIEVYPLSSDRAIDTARCLAKMINNHGRKPSIISCDRGTHFTGQVMKEFCSILNIKLQYHVAWRPESSGLLERAHRTLKNALYIMAKERNSTWVDVLDYCKMALNAQFNSATKCSPFYALYGRNWNLDLPPAPRNFSQSMDPLAYGMNVSRVTHQAQKFIQICNQDADRALDNKPRDSRVNSRIMVGSKVRLYRPRAAENTDKMPWIGSYEVLDTNGRVSKITDGQGYTDWVHNSHILIIPPKIEDFEIPPDHKPEIRVLNLPRFISSRSSSERGVVKSERGDAVRPSKTPTQAAETASESTPRAEPRRSGRTSVPTAKLQVDPAKRSYANVARCAYAMPQKCPNPSKTKR